jgi:hypothetical protein
MGLIREDAILVRDDYVSLKDDNFLGRFPEGGAL